MKKQGAKNSPTLAEGSLEQAFGSMAGEVVN